jgi:hypothetical protein
MFANHVIYLDLKLPAPNGGIHLTAKRKKTHIYAVFLPDKGQHISKKKIQH